MQYTLIDSSEAPARMPRRARRRHPEIEELIAALEPGKVARITVPKGTKGRSVGYRIMQTAARRRKMIDVWEVGGVLYAELAEPDD